MTLSALQNKFVGTKIVTILFLFLSTFSFVRTNAQTGLNFQGVARNSNNVIIASQQISLRLSVLQGSATGTAEYTETRTVTTNAQGLFTAVIGDVGATSTLGNFATINWKNTPKYLKIEMDAAAGNNFITMGTTQFQYVAYAQFANGVDAANIAGIVPVEKGGTGVASITALKTALAINKTTVGLPNVDNTSDLLKPISTATQTALDLKANTTDLANSLVSKLNKTDTSFLLQKADTITLSNRIDLKINATDVTTGLALKIDKVTGKDLSTNDYTTTEKTKLASVTGTNTGDQDLSTYATNTSLALKANTSDINTSLALKENSSNKSSAADLGGISPSDLLYPTQKAVKDYVAVNNAGGGVADNGITTIKLADAAVTDGKINTVSGSKVIGNITGNAATATLATNATTAGNITATSNTTLTSLSNLNTIGTITSGVWSGTTIAIESGGTGVATTTANTFFAGPDGVTGAPNFRTMVAADLPNISTGYIQNSPSTTQTAVIDISGNATIGGSVTIGNALNVKGIYLGIGGTNQTNTNIAIGNSALHGLDDGSNNTTIGIWTMKDNNGGYNNTSVGANALQNLSTGYDNTALGNYAMLNSTVGNYNTATGALALSSNSSTPNSGSYNVANGYKALLYNQNGSNNIGIGYYSLYSNRTGSNNTAVGNQADVASGSLTNATAIGNGAVVNASNKIQLGNASVTLVNTSGGITSGGTITANAGVFTSTTVNGKVIVGANSAASSSAVLEVSSTTQGFLPPRMTYYQRTQIVSPIAGLVIWCSNCGASGELQVFNGVAWTLFDGNTANSVPALNIGDAYQGGKVAYVLQSGDPGYDANTPHGLIAATLDQGTIRWDNGPQTFLGGTESALGTGLANTNAIIARQGATATDYAAGLARAYNGGGYSDWYLPSLNELYKLYPNRVAIGNFVGQPYWSSTEINYYSAEVVGFGAGGGGWSNKYNALYVRAIRSF